MNQNWEKEARKVSARLGEECVSVICFFLSGDFRVVLYEKSCVLPSLCGITGEKYALGLNFTFTNECCNTHLCNGAATSAAPYWIGTLFTLLTLYSVWWIVNDIKQFGRESSYFRPLTDKSCTKPFLNNIFIYFYSNSKSVTMRQAHQCNVQIHTDTHEKVQRLKQTMSW